MGELTPVNIAAERSKTRDLKRWQSCWDLAAVSYRNVLAMSIASPSMMAPSLSSNVKCAISPILIMRWHHSNVHHNTFCLLNHRNRQKHNIHHTLSLLQ